MKHTNSIIRRIVVTEKSAEMAEKQNKYFFEVDPKANKMEIKQAVEKGYKVQIKSVNTIQCTGKKKRLRTMQYGKKPDWKKAIVTLKEGSKIELT